MDKIKCNISIDVDKNLFYAVAAMANIELPDKTMGDILAHGDYEITLSDIGVDEAKAKGFALGLAGVILGNHLETEQDNG